MSELGERVTLSRTRVSRLVDEMTAAGLVRREANPDDRRSAYAVLTTQGRTAVPAGRADLPGRHRPSTSGGADRSPN